MRGQCGQASRFTAEQIEQAKRMQREYWRITRQRKAMMFDLGMTADEWSRYTRGILGKKPARCAE